MTGTRDVRQAAKQCNHLTCWENLPAKNKNYNHYWVRLFEDDWKFLAEHNDRIFNHSFAKEEVIFPRINFVLCWLQHFHGVSLSVFYPHWSFLTFAGGWRIELKFSISHSWGPCGTLTRTRNGIKESSNENFDSDRTNGTWCLEACRALKVREVFEPR